MINIDSILWVNNSTYERKIADQIPIYGRRKKPILTYIISVIKKQYSFVTKSI